MTTHRNILLTLLVSLTLSSCNLLGPVDDIQPDFVLTDDDVITDIKFLPIKFDKLRMKLEAAARQKYDKAITFEFSQNGGTFIFGARCLLCQQIAFESLEVLFHPYALLFSLHEGF